MKKDNITLGICTSFDSTYKHYISACEELKIPYKIIDIYAHDWIDQIRNSNCDGYLLRPPCAIQEQKDIFDERMYFLHYEMEKPIYPEFKELYIYENKRNMAYWLKINNFPHAETRVFSRKNDALSYLDSCEYPVVLKGNIGSSAKRVEIIKSKSKAKRIARKTFGYIHPEVTLGHVTYASLWGIKLPIPHFGLAQRHYLIVQDYKKIKWEWRIIKIGNSYFGHKKLLKGEFASGSKLVEFVKPPMELLELVKEVSEKGQFRSIALDVFETVDDKFFINEIQSIFGSHDNSQMYIDEVPGRFKYIDGEFVFEEGVFNRHGSYLLRVEHFLELLNG